MGMRMRLAAVLAVLAVPIAGAEAAPQMLGVVASAEPKPLYCANGTCTVEFSAFCLQEERDIPPWGTVYSLLDTDAITLQAAMPDGTVVRRTVGDVARITSARGHWAVTIAVPQSLVEDLGATRAGIAVGELVSLVPEPVAGDPDPLTPDEIAYAAGTLRAAASPLTDGDEPLAVAAGLVNDMINAMPEAYTEAYTQGASPGESLWERTVGERPGLDGADPGVRRAAKSYQDCRGTVAPGDRANLRRCLEINHDGFMSEINRRYWTLVGAGV